MKRNVIVNLRENGAISVLVVWNVRYVGGIMWSMCDMEMGVCGTTKRFLGAHCLRGLLFAESVVQ